MELPIQRNWNLLSANAGMATLAAIQVGRKYNKEEHYRDGRSLGAPYYIQVFGEEGNRFYKLKAYQTAITRHDKAIQYLYVLLKLAPFEDAKNQCDLTLKLDLFNVKARFRRAQALVKLGMMEEALKDLQTTIRLDPSTRKVKAELHKAEQMYKSACRKDRLQSLINDHNNSTRNRADSHDKVVFDPLNLSKLSNSRISNNRRGISVTSPPKIEVLLVPQRLKTNILQIIC
ncbi:hypothetical protein Cgig2_001923 [Carnegiea gigantea]|uniref:Uncharacterized protein n=1 Tax=Carnegiea gigantea TaxID=171969 RepID=A0A9Q1K897_9CARY|nr:hypothetical protein Cgig2_001923 [Carnegiea gigantea]